MGRFFTPERFGRPQFIGGMLLLCFLAQCAWLVGRGLQRSQDAPGEMFQVQAGVRQWTGGPVAGMPSNAAEQVPVPPELESNGGYDPHHSPLWYLIPAAPLALWPKLTHVDSMGIAYWGWLVRAPYLVFGGLLGASLWYVARRLYGDVGGYIALVLYCFSPAMIRSSSLWAAQPEMGAAWGAFGAIFTAMAVAHTLYAPREVVLWNWRRTLLLALSLALAVGCQFSLIIVVPLALAFMLYLAPTRRGAAAGIWATSCVLGALLLYGSYFFHPRALWEGLRHATFLGITWQAFGMMGAYRQLLAQVTQGSPALTLALPVSLLTYSVWPRTRYFGNTAPLLVAGLFLVLGIGTPHYPGLGFQLIAMPFLFVFVAGIIADLLETRYRNLVLASVAGLLAAYVIWNVIELARLAA
ncbi:MAG: hypothetical protein LAO03_15425 [Acidobacteriia bacterium]|nr:hypothetical protein [Terriglobia bacterium]